MGSLSSPKHRNYPAPAYILGLQTIKANMFSCIGLFREKTSNYEQTTLLPQFNGNATLTSDAK
jgi:hypothetical protein